jgi:thioredoxin-dependent peroxiredoxin
MKKIEVGDTLPSFALPNQNGEVITITPHRGKKMVLFFYPKDHTHGCTAEVCSFRDNYELFKSKGVEVYGISSDSVASHKKFSLKHQLNYNLLSDKGGKIRKLFGVPATFWFIPGRVTYLINAEGKIVHVFNSLFNSEQHVQEALEKLR